MGERTSGIEVRGRFEIGFVGTIAPPLHRSSFPCCERFRQSILKYIFYNKLSFIVKFWSEYAYSLIYTCVPQVNSQLNSITIQYIFEKSFEGGHKAITKQSVLGIWPVSDPGVA
jgi:hypothetical protein